MKNEKEACGLNPNQLDLGNVWLANLRKCDGMGFDRASASVLNVSCQNFPDCQARTQIKTGLITGQCIGEVMSQIQFEASDPESDIAKSIEAARIEGCANNSSNS